jgi:thiol-disulfide isomerase/thioredoxin
MRSAKLIAPLLVVVLAASLVKVLGSKTPETLSTLKKELESAGEEYDRTQKPGTSETTRQEASDQFDKRLVSIARRALALARAHPEDPEAPAALVWIFNGGPGSNPTKTRAECDAAYDLMAERFLDREAILPIIAMAWSDACDTIHAEKLLRAAVERSPNRQVQGLACLSLARNQRKLFEAARDLRDPTRSPAMAAVLNPERLQQLRALKPEDLRREAETLYERTIREFADLRPINKDLPPLGKQAEGALFRLRYLEPGGTLPEVEGEDLDGQPLKLSDYRGKVIVVSFWGTWCGACMAKVDQEKSFVERMKDRPFALIGVNSDEDRDQAKAIVAQQGINWRSFWDPGRKDRISVLWGVSGWPTVFVFDAQGSVVGNGISALTGSDFERAIEELVARAEAAAKKP